MIRRCFAAALLGGSLLFAPLYVDNAIAQPMRPPEPGQPGQPPPGRPGQPPPGQPPPGQPGQPPPGQPGRPGAQPPGQPGQPGARPPGRPGQPTLKRPPGQPAPGEPPFPGHPPIPGMNAGKMPAEKPAAPEPEHCPGHGPNDGPPHINWYQGLLGVNNAKARQPGFANRLFWRYENTSDKCDVNNQPPPVLASFINFAIVAFVLFRFGKGPLADGLAKRKKTIMTEIDAATELHRAAEKRLKDYEKQLSKIETRRTELREESRIAWEAEKARLISEAEERGTRLRRDAELRVTQEMKQAEADLLNEAVDGAVAAAEELLKKRIQSTDQDRLADDFAKGLGDSLKAGQRPSERRLA